MRSLPWILLAWLAPIILQAEPVLESRWMAVELSSDAIELTSLSADYPMRVRMPLEDSRGSRRSPFH